MDGNRKLRRTRSQQSLGDTVSSSSCWIENNQDVTSTKIEQNTEADSKPSTTSKPDDIGPPPVTSTVATSPEMTASELGFDTTSPEFSMSLFDSSPPERKPFFGEPPTDVVYTTLPPYPGADGEPAAGVTPVGLLTTASPQGVLSNGLGSSPPAVTASLPTTGSSLALPPQTSVTIVFEHNNSNPAPESTAPSKKYVSTKNMGISKSASDQNFAPADSNSTTPTKSFVPCKVCGDKASGYHYGVTSCEGCKGFFRRSIQKQIEYRCLRDGRCLVIRLNRNRCQYCRFKKCLAVGMSRDSVRYGRVPKRSRERNEETRVTQAEADQSAREIENKQLAMYDIILTISHAHHTNCAYTEEKTRGLVRKPAVFSLDDYQSGTVDSSCSGPMTADSLEQQKIVMWQHFAVLLTPSIQRVVEFAKRVPGFLDLTQDDQLILIKLGFFEIWLVHISRMISSIDNTVTFSDGSFITRQQMELMFDHDFVSTLFNFAVTFNNLQLNDTEIGLFCAAVLLTSERAGIYDNKAIDQHQEKLTEALKLQVGRNHPSEPHIFPNLTVKLSELRSLGAKHMEHLQWFRANWTRLRLPPLFAEIFDIPKPEENVQQQ